MELELEIATFWANFLLYCEEYNDFLSCDNIHNKNSHSNYPLKIDNKRDTFIVSLQTLQELRSSSLSKANNLFKSHFKTNKEEKSTFNSINIKENISQPDLQQLADTLVRLFRNFIKMELHLSSSSLISNNLQKVRLRSLKKRIPSQKKEEKDLTTREIGLLLIQEDVTNRLKEMASLALSNGMLGSNVGCGVYILNLWKEINSLEIC